MTEKPRFSISLDDDLFERVDEYQHKNRIATRSQAIVRLIETGYSALMEEIGETSANARMLEYARSISQDEHDLIAGYRAASADRRDDMLEMARKAIKRKNARKSSNSIYEETA